MITLRFIQKRSKQKKDGTIPVYLRLTENRRSLFITSGISVKPEQWNHEKSKVRKNHPASDSLNSRLEMFIVTAWNKHAELERESRANAETLAKILRKNGSSVSFHEYADRVIKTILDEDHYHSSVKTQVAVSKFMEFRKNKATSFSDINSSLLSQFVTWLRITKKNKPNTIAKDIAGILRILKAAERDDLIKAVPKVDGIKKEKTTKHKLNPDQIGKIESLNLEPYTRLWHSRNYFLFSYYYAGMRWGDLCVIKWSNIIDGKLEYLMQKTGKMFPHPMTISDLANKILDLYRADDVNPESYIFPILNDDVEYINDRFLKKKIGSRNAMVNQDLKEIAKLANIELNVSFHVARHSAAYRMLLEGEGIFMISKALAHENISVTETYLRGIDDIIIVKAMEKVFNKKTIEIAENDG